MRSRGNGGRSCGEDGLPRGIARARLRATAAVLAGCCVGLAGCTAFSRLGNDERGIEYGKTWFVGGAGGIGNLAGTLDVPRGLRRAHYEGAIEVFAWQSVLGGTLRDIMDRQRNEAQALELAQRIRAYIDTHPGRRVNIIALSAGTGITTWALESLPREYRIGTVVFLASALSSECDLSRALDRIDGHLYAFYSGGDPLLLLGLPLTGTVDRGTGLGVAGLRGFAVPPAADERVRAVYARKLRLQAYRPEWSRLGYWGLHADSTAPEFIREVVYPLLSEPLAAGAVNPDHAPSAAADCSLSP